MSADVELLHQCDFCGRFVSVTSTHVSYETVRWLSDAEVLVRAGTYCGPYCARRAGKAALPASGR